MRLNEIGDGLKLDENEGLEVKKKGEREIEILYWTGGNAP